MKRWTPTDYMVDAEGQPDEGLHEYVRVDDLPRWIPVSERLPERGDTIWIFDRDGVGLGEFHGEYGFQTYGASCDREGLNSETLFDVTHWMELQVPEPPEVK